MFNIRKNKKGFTLVELIVVIAILAILAGTAAGIGVGLINNSANKNAQNEANLLANDLKSFILTLDDSSASAAEGEDNTSTVEGLWEDDASGVVEMLLGGEGSVFGEGFKGYIETDPDQKDKVMAAHDGDIPDKAALKDADCIAGSHHFDLTVTAYNQTDQTFTVTIACAVKGAAKYKGEDIITAEYTYADLVG